MEIIRENEINRDNVRFNGNDIALAAVMVDKLGTTMDIMYYLMDHGEERGFVVMLVTGQSIDLKALLEKEKRDTDILFEIDKEASLYAIICQDTKIDGGYHFADRVVRNMIVHKSENIYCTELEVRTTVHNIKYVIFKLLETFIKTKQNKKQGEIIFKTLN
ncbi:MAG: hypothetical protein P794_04020 [Epsilonproteobacteria bacterium (ex Lamellibrachia satsuma)]|nr:MAG: hypothetical protein P794_04020 [Epsilonproteobacteria bacterium (ex Lamellibrachia satsuma)]